MDLEELKRIRKANILAHKKKKKAYYLKKKLEKSNATAVSKAIDYEKELFSGDFASKMQSIAKKQKGYVDDRKDIIISKMTEYREKKQQYYQENKKIRLEYDKAYRENKKEDLKEYRKEYYKKNKDKILAKQKEARKLKVTDGK